MTRARAVLLAAAASAIVQVASAAFLVRTFDSPNLSTAIARGLLTRGEYVAEGWRVRGAPSAFRAFQLPGEPLYEAAALRTLPAGAARYLHVPVTVLFAASIAWVAYTLAGPGGAAIAAAIAVLHPFVVVHGPVWDDCFLAAASLWLCAAVIASSRPPSALTLSALVVAAGVAASARSTAALACALFVLLTWLRPSLKPLRRDALAMAAGCAIVLGAWGARNLAVIGHAELGSTHDGITMWESIGPYAWRSLLSGNIEAYSYNAEAMAGHWRRTAALDESGANRYYERAAIAWAVEHPLALASVALTKIAASVTGVQVDRPLTGRRNLLLLILNIALLCAAIAGGWRFGGSAVLALPLCIAAADLLAIAVGPNGMRYQIAFAGLVWVLAAAWLPEPAP